MTRPDTISKWERTLPERFDANVARTEGGCWLWQGSKTRGGYGQIKRRGTKVYAHRYAYERAKGRILGGLMVLHSCDTPACVNPDHLFAGSAWDNTRDMYAKGRERIPTREQTHCKRGHPLAGDNLVKRSSGGRICKTCNRNIQWLRDRLAGKPFKRAGGRPTEEDMARWEAIAGAMDAEEAAKRRQA